MEKKFYAYVSTKAACDPCRTVFVCPPAAAVPDREAAERFAVQTGWRELAEESGSVLIIPVVLGGWETESTGLLMEIYKENCGRFATRSGRAIWGRGGMLWCWETLLYLAGYGDGAVFAGNLLVEYPNMFAAAALVNGMPEDYSAADVLSCHWLTPKVSAGYRKKNREIPVHLWMFQKEGTDTKIAMRHFRESYGAYTESEVWVRGLRGSMTKAKENPAWQTRVFFGTFEAGDARLNRMIWEECFCHVIRWKNGPDGTLALADSKEEFYENPRFLRRRVRVNGNSYEYFVHLPKGKEYRRGLALVFTVHGRGEPAWLFTAKNGWDRLADETGEFILVSPDSPGNIWFLPRDGMLFPEIVSRMAEEFGIDTGRVYLTGFSNGGMMVREAAVSYPQLFAGVSPWNAPPGNTGAMMKADTSMMEPEFDAEFTAVLDAFLESGFEMPFAFVFGDQDRAADAGKDRMIAPAARANGLVGWQRREEAHFCTFLGKNEEGKTLMTVTVMRDMPHGATEEESRFTWDFLKRFRRTDGAHRIMCAETES